MIVPISIVELPHDKTNKVACAPSEDSDQPGHPASLIRVFAVRMKKAWVLSYPLSAQRRFWSDWASDQSLRWAHMPFCWFCHEVAQFTTTVSKHVRQRQKCHGKHYVYMYINTWRPNYWYTQHQWKQLLKLIRVSGSIWLLLSMKIN